MSPHLVPAPPPAVAAPAHPPETERPPHSSESHTASPAQHVSFFHETRNIHQFPASFAAVVPHDWLNNPDSLKNLEESFRIASNLDWANIDLSGYPGQLCESLHAKWILRRLWVYVQTLVSTLPLSDGCACALWGV